MTDETDFSPGDIVLDRDTNEQSPAYVTTLPDATAAEWIAYEDEDEGEEITVAQDNPDYPADAPVVVVVHTTNVHYDLPDWDRYTSLSVSELEEADALYYAFPAPRLVRDKERPHAPDAQRARAESGGGKDESNDGQASIPTLTDIQHVGEDRAEDLRAEGYESVAEVAKADQSGLADVNGIGEKRAAAIAASATELLGNQQTDAPGETETDAAEDRETTDDETDTSTDLSAAIVALSRYLDTDSMDAEIADDGQSVRVTNADDSYRVSLDGVEGDGPHRSQLEEAVEKVRAATQATNG